MSGLSFVERLSALDKPDEANDTEQIWMIIRTFLGIVRVLIFVSIIVIAEMLEEIFIANLSLAVWSLIVGIPLFVLISSLIILGNKKFLKESKKSQKTAVLRPIMKRVQITIQPCHLFGLSIGQHRLHRLRLVHRAYLVQLQPHLPQTGFHQHF